MVVRRVAPKKKVAKAPLPRKIKTGIAAAPINSYRDFNDYIRTEVDKKDVSLAIKAYIRKNLPKKDSQFALQAPEWMYTAHPFLASIVLWKEKGFPFPDNGDYMGILNKNIQRMVEAGKIKAEPEEEEEEKKEVSVKRSPQEIIKEKTSDFIACVDEVLDIWSNGTWVDIENYSVYNEFKKIDASYITARKVLDYFTPIRDEASELVNKKTPELVEGYSHMSVARRKEYLSLLDRIVTDTEKFLLSKKALRKTRKPKVKSADKQVEKLSYLKESLEYKVVSINPTQIVGANRVYLFNVTTRILSELVCRLPNGFEVKGTTIQGLDEDLSRQVMLRKPNEFLPIIQNKTVNQITKEWNNLTTKTNKGNGRINKDTIILKVFGR